MPFRIVQGDITEIAADAIVNTANPQPFFGRGTDEAVYSAAGRKKLLRARREIGSMAPGETAVTEAFRLPAKYIIHTVGPVWRGGEQGEEETLASCYRKSLLLAKQLGCESVAFPLISAGTNGFPKDLALRTALDTIRGYLAGEEEEPDVRLVIYDRRIYALSDALADDVQTYISRSFRPEAPAALQADTSELPDLAGAAPHPYNAAPSMALPPGYFAEKETSADEEVFEDSELSVTGAAGSVHAPASHFRGKKKKEERRLEDLPEQVGESFQTCLFRLIDERGRTDADVYKKANLDRRLFSKIRSNPQYHPKKQTALALAMALELNLDETVDLVGRAGFALSDSNLFDLIIEYCIGHRIYDLMTVNSILFEHDQPLLG